MQPRIAVTTLRVYKDDTRKSSNGLCGRPDGPASSPVITTTQGEPSALPRLLVRYSSALVYGSLSRSPPAAARLWSARHVIALLATFQL